MTRIMRTYQALLSVVEKALARLSEPDGPTLLTFWAGRGGGKTTLLGLLRELYSNEGNTTPLGPWDARSLSHDVPAQEVLAVIEGAPPEKKKLVLLDDLDELLRADDGAPFFAFEQKVIHKLLERGDTLIIATSRAPLIQWRDYDVRVAAENVHIPPLSREEVAGWAKARQLDPERAFAVSLGHPLVLAWFQEQPDLSQEEINRRVAERFLEGLCEKTRQLAEVASLFPVFDIAALRPVLPNGEDEDSFYGEYVEQIGELVRAGLVSWDGENGAYRFREGTVRRLLARGFLHRRPADFWRVHQAATDYYQREARRAGYLHRTLVSAIYHLAQVHRAEGAEAAGEACSRWVEENLGLWKGAEWDAVLRAWRTGAGDEATKEEVQELLGPGTFERITRLLESAAQAAQIVEVKS